MSRLSVTGLHDISRMSQNDMHLSTSSFQNSVYEKTSDRYSLLTFKNVSMNLGLPQESRGVLGLKAISVVNHNERFKIIPVEEEKSSLNAEKDVQFNRYDQVWVNLPKELAIELEKSFSITLQQSNPMLCLRMALQKFRDAEKVQ